MNQDFHDEFFERRSPDIWSRLSRWLWLLLFLLLAATAFLLILPERRKRDTMKAQLSVLEARIAEQDAELEQLRSRIRLVRDDPGYFEVVARDKLRLAKPDEHVIRVAPEPKPPAEPPAR